MNGKTENERKAGTDTLFPYTTLFRSVQGGYLYVNGERLNAGNRLDQVSLAGLAENPVELGEGEYFLLGDNRDSSEDSRFANVGNVRQEQILGKVWLRIFPIKDFGPVRSH